MLQVINREPVAPQLNHLTIDDPECLETLLTLRPEHVNELLPV